MLTTLASIFVKYGRKFTNKTMLKSLEVNGAVLPKQ